MNKIKEYIEKMFEDIKHIDENSNEYWSARELQHILKYTQWRKIEGVISKAKISCENSNINNLEHFDNVGKTIKMAKNATKEVIVFAQTYFAIQTRNLV